MMTKREPKFIKTIQEIAIAEKTFLSSTARFLRWQNLVIAGEAPPVPDEIVEFVGVFNTDFSSAAAKLALRDLIAPFVLSIV